MKQVHETNIEFLELKESYGLSISQLAKAMGCGIDSIKGYICTPDTPRHYVVPLSKLILLRLLVKGRHKKALATNKATRGKDTKMNNANKEVY